MPKRSATKWFQRLPQRWRRYRISLENTVCRNYLGVHIRCSSPHCLRHAHHCSRRLIAMWIQFHRLTNDIGGFRAGAGLQAHFMPSYSSFRCEGLNPSIRMARNDDADRIWYIILLERVRRISLSQVGLHHRPNRFFDFRHLLSASRPIMSIVHVHHVNRPVDMDAVGVQLTSNISI